jgi:uncharacterized membrane-anchored protein YjiN (DUF445 family)
MRREIARIEDDPARAAEIGATVRRVLTHPTLQTWTFDIWSRARGALTADAARTDGRTVAFIAGALGNLGAMLESDVGVRARVQRAAEGVAVSLLPAAQRQVSDFIAEVISNWDADTITDKLELRVGKDLQYVRINGTLVGFLAGGALWAILRALFGHVSF